MTSASILDISEIEDDEVPLATSSSQPNPNINSQNHASDYHIRGHTHGGQTNSRQNQSVATTNRQNLSSGNSHSNSNDQHQSQPQRQAQFYLYDEDFNPQRRIPNLLTNMIKSSPAGASLATNSIPAIDYNVDGKYELKDMDSPTPSPNPNGNDENAERRSVTPAGNQGPSSENSEKKANLSTLSGVYFPCVQNIFGVILFIRMVWIVGTAGVPTAFAIVFICCCVTFTTSISLSAIATNGIVPAGGPYFMISRSLGPECGGAVGTMFFLGTTVAGAMYITGAVEIMLNYLAPSWGLFGDFQRDVNIMYHNIRVYGTILLILVGMLVWIGVKFVSKLAPIALFCVLFSIFSIYAGIFINYNGRQDLMICVMGDRLVTLKNIPFDEPPPDEQQHHYQQGKNMTKQSMSEYQLRRTKALCTFEVLSHIYCPDESYNHNQRSNYVMSPDQQQQQPTNEQQPDKQQPETSDEAKLMADLFKRPPNMSNCDPYFSANQNRIHLERAVPGIASGVLFQNLKPRFRTKRTIVSYDDGINTNERNNYNQIFVDITTSFTILISIYFPSCTGILAGSNRSGDLADAQKSIPRGTLSAQLTTSFVYLSCIVLFGSTFNNLFIRDKFGESMGGQLAVTQIAWPHPYIILIGGLLSTLGASLQSLVGAPRVLQGIAKDEVIPCFNRFAKLSARGEPETAIIFTLFLSWLAVLIGNLDFIAPILTISLVMCYFFINLACTLHSLLGSPNWRPRFKHYHWTISTIGCLLCLFVMVVSSLVYFLVAIFIASCIYKYIEFSGAEKEWGDGKQGLALSAARYNLLRLKTSEPHTKNWRPQLLLFCKLKPSAELEPPSARAAKRSQSKLAMLSSASEGNQLALSPFIPTSQTQTSIDPNPSPTSRMSPLDASSCQLKVGHPKLLTFASQLKAGKGLTLVSSIIEGDFKQLAPLANQARQSLQESMNEEKVKGFADVVVAPKIMDGLSYQIQTAGLGGLKHNTVIVSWPEHWRRYASAPPTLPKPPNLLINQLTASNTQQSQRGSLKQAPTQAGQSNGHKLAAGQSGGNKQNQHQHQAMSTRAHLFIELMRNVQTSSNALLVIKGVDSWPESCDRLGGFIDIWWIVNDGGLLMLLPHLLKQHRTWKSCQMRIFTVAQPTDNVIQMREDLSKFLYHLRMEAQVDIVEMNNVEISAYAYERTLMMEQRSELIKRFNVNRKQSLLLEQEVDGRVIRFRIRKPSTSDFEDTIPFQFSQGSNVYNCQQAQSPLSEHLPTIEAPPTINENSSGGNLEADEDAGSENHEHEQLRHQQQHQQQQQQQSAAGSANTLRPDDTNVRRMHTALTLNEAILKRSKSAKLVIINLPGAPKLSTTEAENNYMEFVEIITDKLERVLLVQNGGREVITIHS